MYPCLHSQRNDPGLLRHSEFSALQSSSPRAHSSTSEEEVNEVSLRNKKKFLNQSKKVKIHTLDPSTSLYMNLKKQSADFYNLFATLSFGKKARIYIHQITIYYICNLS